MALVSFEGISRMIYRPIVIDEEILFSQKKFLVTKTDLKGNILFANKNFCEISGYKEEELIGAPHNALRHPDMPRAIFFLIWSALLKEREVSAVIKNLAKDGRYYWVIADFSFKRDSHKNIDSFSAFRRAAPNQVVENIEELYEMMLSMEKSYGIKGSLAYLESFLEEKSLTYDAFLGELIRPKGLVGTFLSSFNRMFE